MDWPNWRGPQQNRVSTEKGLVDNWDPDGGAGSNLLWKKRGAWPAARRRSCCAASSTRSSATSRRRPNEGEKVVCVDAATGKILWEHRFNVYLSDVPAERIGWSSVVGDPETGRVYAQGVCGYFCCLDGETGKLVWDHSLHEEFGLISTYGGRTNVPVVFEDTVLISAVIVGWGDEPKWGRFAVPAHRFMCFDKATGELRWINGTGISPYDTTYSTPTVPADRRPAATRLRLGRRRRLVAAAAHRQSRLELPVRPGRHQRLAAGDARWPRLHQPQRREHGRQLDGRRSSRSTARSPAT